MMTNNLALFRFVLGFNRAAKNSVFMGVHGNIFFVFDLCGFLPSKPLNTAKITELNLFRALWLYSLYRLKLFKTRKSVTMLAHSLRVA